MGFARNASVGIPEGKAFSSLNVAKWLAYTLGLLGLIVLVAFAAWLQITTDKTGVAAPPDQPIGFRYDPSRRGLPPVKCGLPNIGNTCYMNAAIQFLRHNTLISNFFKRADVQAVINEPRSASAQWLSAFDDLLDMLRYSEWRGHCRRVDTRPIYDAMRLAAPGTFRVAYRQEDALEVIHLFFEAVEQVLGRKPQAIAVWRGLVSCRRVVYQRRWGGPDGPSESRVLEVGSDLRLSVPDQKEPIRMGVLLHRYFNEEPEERDTSGWFQETRLLQAAPDVLVIALNRAGRHRRIRTPVEIPCWINLRPYMEDNEPAPAIYDLVSTVQHLGNSAGSGHYVAAVHYADGWLLFDDSFVRPVSHANAIPVRHVWLAIFQKRRLPLL